MFRIKKRSVLVLVAALTRLTPVYPEPEATRAPHMVAEGDLLMEDSMTEAEREALRDNLRQARANIVAAYGDQQDTAVQVIWCKTRECARYLGGPTMRSFATEAGPSRFGGQYAFERPAIVLLRQARAPAGKVLAVETLTHEMSHREFRARLHGATVPKWFDEGVATYLGKEESCLPETGASVDLSGLTTSVAWRTYTDRSNADLIAAYCRARNEVEHWVSTHGGFSAVVALLDARARGRPFDWLYHR